MVATAKCPKCGYENELLACTNCGGMSFRKGAFSDGSYGMICEGCNLGYPHVPCQGQCGAQIATSMFGTPTSRLAENAASGMRAADGGKCFIASEIYGHDSKEVEILRRVRDRDLLPNPLGRSLVALYYRVSPSIIPLMRRSSVVRIPICALVAISVLLADLRKRS
jgi:hypothetical protein